MTQPQTNWARNVTFQAARVHRPRSIGELQEIVAGSDRLRALGTGHSFSTVADTTGDLVSVVDLPRAVSVDAERATVTTGAGGSYGELAGFLHAAGWALPNLGSLPQISVAGACATGTHGSGRRLGCLATSVSGVQLVRPDGELLTFRRGHADFAGAVVALGSLGVVTALTLDVVPTFDVRQVVYLGLPHATVSERFDEVLDSAYSVSVFTDWRGDTARVFRKNRVGVDDVADGDFAPDWLGATAATVPSHPVPGAETAGATEQLGVPGPWHERLAHFRVNFTPSSGDELQSEYLVAREHGAAAFDAVHAIGAQVAPALQICEIRTVAADDLWLSMASGRDSVALHFTWFDDVAAATSAIVALERALEPFAPRPHWGKLFAMAPEVVRARYERLPDFQRLRGQLDPRNKLGNEFVDRYLGD
ncbi:MAG: alditol oxidase [Nocardioidaceae bacterium]|nr:alditol oxidase [Nocardioidaceae bacterium]